MWRNLRKKNFRGRNLLVTRLRKIEEVEQEGREREGVSEKGREREREKGKEREREGGRERVREKKGKREENETFESIFG